MNKKLIITTVSFVFVAAILGFIVSVVSSLALFNLFFSLSPSLPIFQESNILVMGLDDIYGTRADTIMVVHVDPDKKNVSLVSIPRDTIVTIPGRGLDKINAAYAYGGEELARKTVQEFLHISVPYYLALNFKGIAKMIDDIGGVTVNVERRMYYVDYAGSLAINLQPGRQKLNGQQAVGYLRFRHSDNDFARIGRQQNFLRDLTGQLLSRENLIKSPSIFLSLMACVYTNMNPRETLGLTLALRGAAELNQIRMATVPGSDVLIDGIYYYRPNQLELDRIVSQFLSDNSLASSNAGVND